MKHTFKKRDLFWSEASVLVQAAVSRWRLNSHARNYLIHNAELWGKVCHCVRLENTSRHEWMVQNGQFNDTCSFEECDPSGDRKDAGYLYDDIFIIRLEQIIFGHAFEIAKARAKEKWPDKKRWPEILEVGRHLRNGAFHNNKFIFKAKEPRGNPSWRSLHITKDLEGQSVFGHAHGVISLGDVPVLMADMMKELS